MAFSAWIPRSLLDLKTKSIFSVQAERSSSGGGCSADVPDLR